MSDNKEMQPVSGEPVEVDGVYSNEWGREQPLKRGDVFPADPQLGTTSWQMVRFAADNHTVETDSSLQHHSKNRSEANKTRLHVDRGDK